MNTEDTIIAPATAVGEGGIAVVRISGSQALQALRAFFRPTANVRKFLAQQLYHGFIVDENDQHIDEVMAVYMPAPHSYTCDDVTEIHCHGSQQVVKAILDLYYSYGLRLAEPGEFTYRAFINNRLDLSQAEAVARLIHAKTDSSRKLALSQVEGQLSQQIHRFSDVLREQLIYLEAWIDFPDEELPPESLVAVQQSINTTIAEIGQLTDSYNTGKVLAEGASILLVGRPNAGKSSLLNHLLGEDRAIVTDIPGTTRDLLEEGITLAGVPVRLVDTAGMRQSVDPVEAEGVRRAKNKIQQADLVLLLIDGSRPVETEDLFSYRACRNAPVFIVRTKIDLAPHADLSFAEYPVYGVSVKTGNGLPELKEAITDFLLSDYLPGDDSVLLTEQRHYEALLAAKRSLMCAQGVLQDQDSFELAAFDIRESLQHLGLVSGETTTDSVLEGIFTRFCIGK